ncbi:MAG: hypothetical protein PHN29_07305, partial [Endomicrobiaceae bacterium]|nr:hypothetical protein [Endomicrobiaceae bacterium]
PHSSLLEVKSAFCNIRLINENNNIRVFNRNDFIIADNKRFKITGFKQSDLFNKSTIEVSDFVLMPKESAVIYKIEDLDCIYTFDICDGNQHIGHFQFIGDKFSLQSQFPPLNNTNNQFRNNVSNLQFDGITYQMTVDKKTGLISKIKTQEYDILNDSLIRVSRAPLDNDMFEFPTWEKYGLNDISINCVRYRIDKNIALLDIEITGKGFTILTGMIKYTAYQNYVDVLFEVKVNEKIEYLPRLGFDLGINPNFKKYCYFGFGPTESYVDKHHGAKIGYYCDIIKPEISYIKPQETMSHYMSKMIKFNIEDKKFVVEGDFSFCYLPYSIEQLSNTKHNYELKSEMLNRLIIDYYMSGIGSNSCGPKLKDKYKLMSKNINFQFKIGVIDDDE